MITHTHIHTHTLSHSHTHIHTHTHTHTLTHTQWREEEEINDILLKPHKNFDKIKKLTLQYYHSRSPTTNTFVYVEQVWSVVCNV
jgi:hypothetical protein